jgi:predicted kinase
MSELYMTIGLPRSGKSTWSKQQGWPVVNPDAIRLALHGERFIAQAEPHVWAIAKTMVRALFLAGHDKVILDATSISPGRRGEWNSTDWANRYVVFKADEKECIRRARAIDDEYIVPVIERMAREFVPLDSGEQLKVFATVEAWPYPYKDSEEHIVGFPTFGRPK